MVDRAFKFLETVEQLLVKYFKHLTNTDGY
jgi:hypothetical protein